MIVDPSNAGNFEAWDGGDGDYWTENEAHFDAAVARYHEPLLDAAQIDRSDRVLDLGCGTGQTTRDAARRASQGEALGVDLSSRQLERAQKRAAEEGVLNACFLHADAQIYEFASESFDVVISRTGASFFGDPVAAFSNIGRALRPGGRLMVATWQSPAENIWFREFIAAIAVGRDLPLPAPTAPGPFGLSDPEQVRTLLTAAGFTDVSLDERHDGMYFGSDAQDAFAFQSQLGIMQWLMRDLEASDRRRALDALYATIAAHDTGNGVWYPSGMWFIGARWK
jgi:SAM-dependent methyltransferase